MSYPRLVMDSSGARVPLLGERVIHYLDARERISAHGTVIGRAQPTTGRWTILVRWDDNADDVGEHSPDELLDGSHLDEELSA